ncbi:hypothetical protein imdm_1374 [gamma proteobacterium IMCC2047]|nr:hypothetical protein imdm_1374 [gamma proteobacterium IMCC2047]
MKEMRRSEPLVAQTPVIALTAEVFEDDGHSLLDEGFDRALFKPLDEVLLINTIVDLKTGATLTKKTKPESAQKGSFLSRLPEELLNEEILRQLSQLDDALQQYDFKSVRDQAHQLRSVLYGLDDADEVVLLVREIEAESHEQDYKKIENLFFELKNNLGRVFGCAGS